jgi:hypothetical protein
MEGLGFPVLDRCSFPQFCEFVYQLHQRISSNKRKLHPSSSPIPLELLEDNQGVDDDGRFIRRMLRIEQWIFVNRQAVLYTYDILMTTIFLDAHREGYLREVSDFCFDRSSLTLRRPRSSVSVYF